MFIWILTDEVLGPSSTELFNKLYLFVYWTSAFSQLLFCGPQREGGWSSAWLVCFACLHESQITVAGVYTIAESCRHSCDPHGPAELQSAHLKAQPPVAVDSFSAAGV